jgi:UDP-N-acetylglucosamine 3-dehydrogenase
LVKQVNLALLGAGYWGTKLAIEYIEAHSYLDKFNFVGIVEPNKERLAYVGHKLNLPSSMLFHDVNVCLANPEISAIHIATPNETHYDIATEALSQHKHILLEKPMALNTRDAFKLARLSESSGNILLVGHIFRFNAALSQVKKILKTQDIGSLRYLHLSWLDNLNPIPNRDIIFDLLPHPIDIINYLTDEWPLSIYARSIMHMHDTSNHKKIEDVGFVIINLPDGSLAEIDLSWIQTGMKERIIIVTGSEASIKIDALSQDITIYKSSGQTNIPVTSNNSMQSMITHFVNCISGIDKPNNSSLVGALTVNVLSSARKSITENTEVRIHE